MDDLRLCCFLFFGILGADSFGSDNPTVTVEKYTTEIFVQKKTRLTLDCSIRTQSRDILYSWTKDGQDLISQSDFPKRKINNRTKVGQDLKSLGRLSIAKNGSLIFERIVNKKKKKRNDEGFYECFGENGDFGTVIGTRVHLRIQRSAFTIVPQDLSASVGGVARFQCQDNLNSVAYVWHPYQHGVSRITSFTGILQISNLTLDDAGQYTCQAFPRLDQPLEKILENTVTLTVNTDPLPVSPHFLNTSQYIRVRQGYPTLLECLVEGQGQFKLNWYRDGSPIKEFKNRVTVIGNSNIKFTSTNSSDSGKYTCAVEINNELVKERVYELEILVPPKIQEDPRRPGSNNLLVQRTRWSCVAEGYPEPTISWYKDGLRLYPAPTLQLKKELVLNGQHADSGYYQCIAENEAGLDIATAYIRFNRKPDTPDKPRNVKVTAVSSTEVNVTWSPAATQGGFDVIAYGIDYYEVHEMSCSGKCAHLFDLQRDISKGIFKVIGKLKPFTEYSFAVQGYCGNGAGLLSGEEIVRTLQAVPSTVPDVLITPDTRTSIRVKWTEIPVKYRHGIIDRYKLWHGTREKMTVLELTADSRNYLITGLEPDTAYRVRVLAGNAAGYPESEEYKELWVEYRTPRALPKVFPTPILTFEAVNSTAVLLNWNCEMFTEVESYRITVQKLLESSAVQEINIPRDRCRFLLTSLVNSTFYKIELMVNSPEDTAIGIATELYQSLAPGMDQQPPPPMDIDLKLLTSSIISLEWERPKTSMMITKYTVMYRKQLGNRDYFLDSHTLSAQLDGLTAFTWYVIAVKSHSEATEGPFSKPVIVQTKEGIPSPPENLLAEVVSPGTVRLKWGPPKKQNGIIRYYIIYYNVDRNEPDQVWNSIQQNASTTMVVVQDLKSKVYYFKLRACTNAGEGLSSHIVAIDTLACSQTPCPQCKPPEDCTNELKVPDQTKDVVSSILQQKLGIIIGCAIGLTCIVFCIIFVIRYRHISIGRRPGTVPNTMSNPCGDNAGQYLSQPGRHEEVGYIRYSPMVQGLEENKNCDTKGGDYVFIKGNGTSVNKEATRNRPNTASVYVPPKVCTEITQPLPDDGKLKSINMTSEADETSAFLTPAEISDDIARHVVDDIHVDEIVHLNEAKIKKGRLTDNQEELIDEPLDDTNMNTEQISEYEGNENGEDIGVGQGTDVGDKTVSKLPEGETERKPYIDRLSRENNMCSIPGKNDKMVKENNETIPKELRSNDESIADSAYNTQDFEMHVGDDIKNKTDGGMKHVQDSEIPEKNDAIDDTREEGTVFSDDTGFDHVKIHNIDKDNTVTGKPNDLAESLLSYQSGFKSAC